MGLRAVSVSEVTANSSTKPSWNGIWLDGSGRERLSEVGGGQGQPLARGPVGEEVRTLGLPPVPAAGDLAPSCVVEPLALHEHQGEVHPDLTVAGGDRLDVGNHSWHGFPFVGVGV